jgi:hypothetical protein
VRRNPLLFDEPVQHRRRPVGRIAREPLRPKTESCFGPLDHRSGGTHLGLADSARCLNIDDHAVLHVDQAVVG